MSQRISNFGFRISYSDIAAEEAQPIGSAGVNHEPVTEHDQVGSPGGPTQGRANLHGVQIDQEKSRTIIGLQSDQNIAGMQVIVHDAGLVNLMEKLAESTGQSASNAFLPRGFEGRQGLLDKGAERLGIFETSRDQEIFAGTPSFAAFAEAQRDDGRNAASGDGLSTFELHGCLRRSH